MTAALITGGASGVGLACSQAFIDAGVDVCIADIEPERISDLRKEPGAGRVITTQIDVTDQDSCLAAVELVEREFGHLEIAVNSAGVGVPRQVPLGEMTFAEWRRLMSVNLDGVFLSMSAEIMAMKRHGNGSIINIASVHSFDAAVGAAHYVSSKHGLIGLTKAAALELAGEGIRVNCVAPGHVDTPMFRAHDHEQQAAIRNKYPSGQVARPGDVSDACLFLAREGSRHITGTSIVIDGGYLSGR